MLHLVVALAWLGAMLCLSGCSDSTLSATAIGAEGRSASGYAEKGAYAVLETLSLDCCDSAGAAFDVWQPMAAGPFPLLIWGNGSDANPSQYRYLLEHLASWGFVVVGTQDPSVGSGDELLSTLAFALEANTQAGHPLFDQIDSQRIGALGHSQGAGGVTNLMLRRPGKLRAIATMAKPAQMWCSKDAPCPSMSGLSEGAVFLINGELDMVIAPSVATPGIPGEQAHESFYQALPQSVEKVWGTTRGGNHNDSQGQPDCAGALGLCGVGLRPMLGYLTAWFLAQLGNDEEARALFLAGSGTLFADSEWINVVSNLR